EGPAALPRLRGARGHPCRDRVRVLGLRPRGERAANRYAGGLRGDSRGATRFTVKPSRAIVLGAVQGPTELLPVSSSAHLTLIPWFLGWRREDGDAEVEKAFAVALHAGGAAALLVDQRQVIIEELRSFDRRRAAVLGLSFLPAAMLG